MNISSSYINARPGRPGADGQIPNILTAKFNHLKDTQDVFPAEPINCGNNKCRALLTSISKLSEPDRTTNRQTWICEYCSHDNKLLITRGEIPSADKEETYLIENPPEPVDIYDTMDRKHVVYCIDTSGSMCETQAVRKEDASSLLKEYIKIEEERLVKIYAEIGEQAIPQSNNYYISRLTFVKMAIEESIHELYKKEPAKVAVLVTFNDKVEIIGDGLIPKLTIDEKILNDKQAIYQIVDRTPRLTSVIRTRDQLIKEIRGLKEEGQTALGPALLYSIQIAARKPNGQVILCTDGLANQGVGSFEAKRPQETAEFYEYLAEYAQTKGVTVSIITLEGTDCKLTQLGDLADKTRGDVKVVSLNNLKDEISSSVKQQSIATNVEAQFNIPKQMYIKDYFDLNSQESMVVKKIGNVNYSTEISFQFAVREGETIQTDTVPMQMQITYTDSNGGRYMRVITKLKPITNDINLVKRDLDRKQIAQYLITNKAEGISKGELPSELKTDEESFNKLSAIFEDDDFDINRYREESDNLDRTFRSRRGNNTAPGSTLFPNLNQRELGLLDNPNEDLSQSRMIRAKQMNSDGFKKQND